MAYQPFDAGLHDLNPDQLADLRNTHEGWYVEYKSEFMKTRDIAKSLSSFANQHGGWMFFGVVDDSETLQAASFPGIPDEKLSNGIESLRNAAKDLIHPHVYYEHRIFQGPISSLDLPEGRSIVGVRIHKGADTPYIHNDGKIYQRVGDSSQPTPVHDRAAFDVLAERGREAREILEESLERHFSVSKAEDEGACYLHLFLTSDPYHMLGHHYKGGFRDFTETMSEKTIPFDNCFTGPGEYVARQSADNDHYQRLLTWHFSERCESFVTLPVPQLPMPAFKSSPWAGYELGESFQEEILGVDVSGARILDLNMIALYLIAVVYRHLELVSGSGVTGPFFAKARIENAWRTIPFIDCEPHLKHVEEFGLPIVQEDEMLIPPGTAIESFLTLRELEQGDVPLPLAAANRAANLMRHVFMALGVPGPVFQEFVGELLEMAERRRTYQSAQGKLQLP